jgi:1,4-dihydroxy-2-naphthoate octaprenyltransferase
LTNPLRSTLQLLRFHFSFFLLPVYLFALSQVNEINWTNAFLSFFILHVLVYPSSNGYNSYMDRDSTPIGGLERPLQPTKQLFYASVVMDIIAIALSCLLGWIFALGILLYITASRVYSFRGIRLKRFPVLGYLTVIIFQGAVVFHIVYHTTELVHTADAPIAGIVAASLLIGGFYPLTQIYQHQADKQDGVQTISATLGYRGTFLFTGIVYALAFMLIAWLFFQKDDWPGFLILQATMLPVIAFYFIWFKKVQNDINAANFKNTMRMNLLASVCTNTAFLILLIREHL